MCDCGNDCKIPVGPIGPQGPGGEDGAQGTTGANGEDGVDGAQGIQGIPGDSVPLVWTDFALINGWTGQLNQTPQYAIRNGLLYTRGQLISGGGTVSGEFAAAAGGITASIRSTIAGIDSPAGLPFVSLLTWNLGTDIFKIDHWGAVVVDIWYLDSIPTLSIK